MNIFKKTLALILILFSFSSSFVVYAENPLKSEISDELKDNLDKIVGILANKKQQLGEEKYKEFIDQLKVKIGYLYFELKNMSGDDLGGSNNNGSNTYNGDDLLLIMDAIKKAVFVEVSGVTDTGNIDSIMDLIKQKVFSDDLIKNYGGTNTTDGEKDIKLENNTVTKPIAKPQDNTVTKPEPKQCTKRHGIVCYKKENIVWAANTCDNGPNGDGWIDKGNVRGNYVWLKRLGTKCR